MILVRHVMLQGKVIKGLCDFIRTGIYLLKVGVKYVLS